MFNETSYYYQLKIAMRAGSVELVEKLRKKYRDKMQQESNEKLLTKRELLREGYQVTRHSRDRLFVIEREFDDVYGIFDDEKKQIEVHTVSGRILSYEEAQKHAIYLTEALEKHLLN